MANPSDLKDDETLNKEARGLLREFMDSRLSQFSESIEQLFSNNLIAKCDTYFDKLFYSTICLDDFGLQSEHCKRFLKIVRLTAITTGDSTNEGDKALIEANGALKKAIVDGIKSSSNSRAKNDLNHIIDKLDDTTYHCYLFIDSIDHIPAISFLISRYAVNDPTEAAMLKAMYFKGITNYGSGMAYYSLRSK